MGFNAKQNWTSKESMGYDGIEMIFVEGSGQQDQMMILGVGEEAAWVGRGKEKRIKMNMKMKEEFSLGPRFLF